MSFSSPLMELTASASHEHYERVDESIPYENRITCYKL